MFDDSHCSRTRLKPSVYTLSTSQRFPPALPSNRLGRGIRKRQSKRKKLSVRTHPIPLVKDEITARATSTHGLLCSQCNPINFDTAFARECANAEDRYTTTPGALSGRHVHFFCTLCHFFVAAPAGSSLEKNWWKIRHRLRTRSRLQIMKCPAMTDLSHERRWRHLIKRNRPVIAYWHLKGPDTPSKCDVNVEKRIFSLTDAASHKHMPFSALQKQIAPHEKVDYGKLRGWITGCQTHHGKCRSGEKFLPPNLKFIDCNKRTVVQMTSTDEYVALSYVWGSNRPTTQQLSLKLGDDLPRCEDIPMVIEDAITAVKSLGYSYLWVDQICINQSDHADRQSQIPNMGLIYENAVVTIISLFGDSAQAGLPGVGDVSRITQPASNTPSGKRLKSSMPSLVYYLERSTWATRGWTYQEAILSRRCLFFTEAQVYFSCQRHVRSEAAEEVVDVDLPKYASYIPALIPKLLSRVPQTAFGDRTSGFGDRTSGFSLVEFYAFLSEYHGCRSLSDQSDTLKAFQGILARCSFYSLWGIPIFSAQLSPDTMQQQQHSAKILALGLNWRVSPSKVTVDQAKRRSGFPTWSWTSVANEVTYLISADTSGLMDDSYFYNLETSQQRIENAIECQVRIVPDKKEHFHSVLRTRQDSSSSRIIPENFQQISFETEVFRSPRLKSLFLSEEGLRRVFDRQSMSIPKTHGDHRDEEGQQQITLHLDQSRPGRQSLEEDNNPEVGLVLLFRSLATKYHPYLFSDQGQSPGIACALVVQWKDDVAERIGTATAPYDFFEASAQREIVQLR